MKTVQGSRLKVQGEKLGKWWLWVVLGVSLVVNGYFLIRGGIGKIREIRGIREGEKIRVVKRVIDGDTFDTTEEERVRLKGADAPEYAEECLSEEAQERLKELILGKEVILKKVVKDHFGRWVGFVFSEGLFIDKVMVEEGLAKDSLGTDPEYGVQLLAAEEIAKKAERGIWSSLCLTKREGCVIKGNVRRDRGTKVYHLPGCFNYEKIVINEREGDQWFCSEKEAEAAGFRKSEDCPKE